MGADSKIEWCDHTFNPWIGCTKVSPGCANCYAEGESKRRGWAQWGKGKERHRTSEAYWRAPLQWNKQPWALLPKDRNQAPILSEPRRPRVFCASLADWLDDEVPESWRADLLTLIYSTPNLDWLLLSKRLENWSKFFEGPIPDNVWIGTSVEDQKRADERIPKLLEIPAKVRFLSCEPLLGTVDLGAAKGLPIYREAPLVREYYSTGAQRDYFERPGRGFCRHDGNLQPWIDWVIIGGESGPSARSCDIEWIRSITDQCQKAKVPVFVKQLGAKPFMGVKRFGPIVRDRKGGDPSEWPEELRVREFPVAGRIET